MKVPPHIFVGQKVTWGSSLWPGYYGTVVTVQDTAVQIQWHEVGIDTTTKPKQIIKYDLPEHFELIRPDLRIPLTQQDEQYYAAITGEVT